MQAQRYVSSVSDLYITDEVELLLDEIRELEPTSCCAEDIQDFEIAGSQTGGGGRSPVGTEQSWDSHAQYRRVPPPPPAAIAPLYCHTHRLCTVLGILRILLVIISACCCGLIWGVVGLRPWLLPLSSRARFLMLAALSSLLLHTLIIFLDVTRLTQLFPFDWNKVTFWLCVWSASAYACGGSLLLHSVLAAPEYTWAPHHIAQMLLAAAGLGLSGFGIAVLLGAVAGAHMRVGGRSRGVIRSPSSPMGRGSSVSVRTATAYRPLPVSVSVAPEPQPGSSRDHQSSPL